MHPPGPLLITGAAGFVGSTLALEFRRQNPGLPILGLDNLGRKGSEGNVGRLHDAGIEFVKGDIRDEALLASLPPAAWVIDCAANPSVLAGMDGRAPAFEVMDHNLVGTLRLLDYCRLHRTGFILMSTSRVYSIAALASLPVVERDGAFCLERADGAGSWTAHGITEDFSTGPPLSLYGMSKRCSEDLALEYGEAFGFPVWINRCGVLAGAGQFGRADQGIFAYWINAWLRRRPLKYTGFGGNGYQVRDCLHPRDLVPLLRLQMEEPGRGVNRIQNVSGGISNSMSLGQLSDWCAGRFGPHGVAADPAPRPFDIPWLVLDSTRAATQWNWQPDTPLTEILEEIARHAELHPGWLESSGA